MGAVVLLALDPGCTTTRKKIETPEHIERWRPVVVQEALESIKLPPPPPAGSAQELREVKQLLALRARRAQAGAQIAYWDAGAVIRWNEIARDLVAQHRGTHTMASRTYALLSVAQYDALLAVRSAHAIFRRRPPASIAPLLEPSIARTDETVYPSDHAVVAAASAGVLRYLFPDQAPALQERATLHQQSRLLAGVNFPSDIDAGVILGSEVARAVVQRARSDGAEQASKVNPAQAFAGGEWTPPSDETPEDPDWGKVRPWLMQSGDQFRPPPPPRRSSREFAAALEEVRRFSDQRTNEQARLAALWADGPGSYAPAGRWNRFAADLVGKHGLGELRAARVFALLNMAVMDAGISAWDAKYHYLTVRPGHADPLITTPVREPSSPSYTCSHAAFSGAAAAVLGYLFPAESAVLKARAEEAAMSRVYGGIQLRYEGEAGLAEGRAVAGLAIARAQSDSAR